MYKIINILLNEQLKLYYSLPVTFQYFVFINCFYGKSFCKIFMSNLFLQHYSAYHRQTTFKYAIHNIRRRMCTIC